jgi:hypothetical protein
MASLYELWLPSTWTWFILKRSAGDCAQRVAAKKRAEPIRTALAGCGIKKRGYC